MICFVSTSACPHSHLAISAVSSAECPTWLLRWTVRLSNRKQTTIVTISWHDHYFSTALKQLTWFFFFVRKLKLNNHTVFRNQSAHGRGSLFDMYEAQKALKYKHLLTKVLTCWPLDLIGWGLSKWVSECVPVNMALWGPENIFNRHVEDISSSPHNFIITFQGDGTSSEARAWGSAQRQEKGLG